MINTVLERLVTVLSIWSKSTKSLIAIPIPLSWGVLGGSSSFSSPYAVADQYYLGNLHRSISGSVGSNTIRLLCFIWENKTCEILLLDGLPVGMP